MLLLVYLVGAGVVVTALAYGMWLRRLLHEMKQIDE
jgi:hypothetical protein